MLHAQKYQEIKKSIDPSEMPATNKEVTKPNSGVQGIRRDEEDAVEG